jgi:uncharacterized protein
MADFTDIQRAFVAHLKNPDVISFDSDIEERRLTIYRDLLFNNIVSFLNSGFPVLKSLYHEDSWLILARQFFSQHHCRSPYFTDISLEFVEYLSTEHQFNNFDPPFLSELAHYEWLELSISIRKNPESLPIWQLNEHKLPHVIRFSPLASLVSYNYPVHQISVDFQPKKPSDPLYLVVFRNNVDEVNFTLVNQVSAHLLNVIQQNEMMGISKILEEMQLALPQLEAITLAKFVQDFVEQMLQQQILLPASAL